MFVNRRLDYRNVDQAGTFHGHFENVERQEVLVPGHWETRPVIVAAPPRHYEESHARIDVRIPF